MGDSTLETLFYAGVIGSFVLIIFVMPLTGIGTPRGESTYTGYIVDTEIDKGFIFRPSTAHLKTHFRASSHESFCLQTEELEQKAMEFQRQEQKVTLTYSRPIFVPPTKCDSSVSLIQKMEPAE